MFWNYLQFEPSSNCAYIWRTWASWIFHGECADCLKTSDDHSSHALLSHGMSNPHILYYSRELAFHALCMSHMSLDYSAVVFLNSARMFCTSAESHSFQLKPSICIQPDADTYILSAHSYNSSGVGWFLMMYSTTVLTCFGKSCLRSHHQYLCGIAVHSVPLCLPMLKMSFPSSRRI